ncbi:hypothetical protein, partial [Runella sp.]|uniref:hypothetical protein n=1 Tax=Runella sp. TaxID=1960881 RepID=UPI00301AB873
IIADVSGLQSALDGKTPYGHTHIIADVSGLQSALDGKTPYGHSHSMSDVTGLSSALAGKSNTGHRHHYTEIDSAPWITGFNETDPWGVSGIYANMEGGNMRITVYMRGGGNFQTVVSVFSGA